MSEPLLAARITASYPGNPPVLDRFCLDIHSGEIVGLIGESGSGKSTVSLALLRLLEYKGGTLSGEIRFDGRNLMLASAREMRGIRGRRISMVMQSPLSSLNPAMSIGRQILESWRAHRDPGAPPPDLAALLHRVNLSPDNGFLDRRPNQISIGQAQRVLIAMAILHGPALLIADEPTSALDACTQSEILNLFRRLNRELAMSILLVSHDLLSVASLCHRIAILREGRVVEENVTEEIFRSPIHPYTRRLIDSIPEAPARPSRYAPAS